MKNQVMRRLAWNALVHIRRPWRLIVICLLGIAVISIYPSDLDVYRETPPSTHPIVVGVEDYGRYINTAVQIGLPFVMRDPVGILQNLYIAVGSTMLTHGLKRALDPVLVAGTQLGERPNGGRHNMPSGHSSMASSAMYFVGRRYGWWHLIYMLPILLMTMFARVALDAHTISAVLAGALAGIVGAALFTSSFPPQVNIEFVKNEILRIGRASSR
ncbi:phosphatase PAP2 family protein [Herbaspirillum aquaticum]|uniref:phosphatase PAP2 family protein n=1 Tax=Herbaspirillum aquaticum TaxID=568783 RepID=UPI0024DEA0A9